MEDAKEDGRGLKKENRSHPRLRFSYGLRHAVVISSDIFAFIVAFFLALLVGGIVNGLSFDSTYAEGIAETFEWRAIQFAVLASGAVFIFFVLGHYRLPVPVWTAYSHIVIICLIMLLADGFLVYAAKYHLSRLWLVSTWLLAAGLIPFGRVITRRILDGLGIWRIPSLLVGTGEVTDHIRRALAADPTLGYEIIDVIDPAVMETPKNGQLWRQFCEKRGARFVILSLSDQEMTTYSDLLSDLVWERLPFAVVPSLGGLPILGFDQLSFIGQDFMMLVAKNNLGQPIRRRVKFVSDIVMASLLTLAFLPIFILFSGLISRDGGSILFRHQRVGQGGRLFDCLKFRTMVPNAQQVLEAHLREHPEDAAEWQEHFKLRNDPRVTPIGRFLRSTSLDELPQLFNVLRGDMSLVGPRPVTEEELPYYGRDVMFYLETRPGITGLWQVSGRSDTSYAQRVMFDTWYVKNWTLWHDIAILAKTIPVVLARKGAV